MIIIKTELIVTYLTKLLILCKNKQDTRIDVKGLWKRRCLRSLVPVSPARYKMHLSYKVASYHVTTSSAESCPSSPSLHFHTRPLRTSPLPCLMDSLCEAG